MMGAVADLKEKLEGRQQQIIKGLKQKDKQKIVQAISTPIMQGNGGGSNIKDKATGNKNNGGGEVKVNIAPGETKGFSALDLAGTFFPPAQLYNISQGGLPPGTKMPPETEISGSPEEVAKLKTGVDLKPKSNGGGGSDPFAGALKSIGGGLKLAGMAIPVMIGVMILSQLKGLFK